jgi:hypothetical protein
VRYFTRSIEALSYAFAVIIWVPALKLAVDIEVPPFTVVTPSIVQSTLMTAGSMTFTRRVAGLSAAAGAMVVPAIGSVESIGVNPARQMLKTICSREGELKLVFTLFPNRLFIIEFADGRYWPEPT